VFRRILIVWFRLFPFVLAFARDRRRWIVAGPPRLASDEDHRRRARKLTATIASLGPSFIKMAQVFAIRADIVPPLYLEELSRLHDRVPPFPTHQVRRRIREELKRDPDQIFERFDAAPLAAASLGQVHRARYRGTEVIVKVLRPRVQELVATDVQIVRSLLFILEQLGDHYTLRAAGTIIEEFSRVITEEMDFEHEADNIERFREIFKDSDTVVIPVVFRELTTSRVLVLKFYEGMRINESAEILKHNIDVDKMIRDLIEIYGHQLLLHGVFHADPHPGNILIQPDGHIVFLDFGMVIEVAADFRRDLIRVVIAVVRQDIDELIALLYRLDLIEPDVSPATIKEAAAAILSITYDESRSALQIQEIANQILNTFYRFPLHLPSSAVYILRTLALIEGIGITYDPKFVLGRAARPIAKDLVDRVLGPPGFTTLKDRVVKETLGIYNFFKNLESVFARMDRDQLRIRLHPADVDGLEKFISHLFRRVVMTISGVGFAIVTGLIYVRLGSLLLLTVGLLFSFSLIALVFLLPNPQRYPFRIRRARRAGKVF
jgi:predicted unusual protein kinase regulating ubiquinone biosynthesis (AarF/ABC1/UbiB family)